MKNKNGCGCFVWGEKAHLKKLYFYTIQQNVYLIAHCHVSVCNFMWSRKHLTILVHMKMRGTHDIH